MILELCVSILSPFSQNFVQSPFQATFSAPLVGAPITEPYRTGIGRNPQMPLTVQHRHCYCYNLLRSFSSKHLDQGNYDRASPGWNPHCPYAFTIDLTIPRPSRTGFLFSGDRATGLLAIMPAISNSFA